MRMLMQQEDLGGTSPALSGANLDSSNVTEAWTRIRGRLREEIGEIEYRTDPQWFTPYLRRETVEW